MVRWSDPTLVAYMKGKGSQKSHTFATLTGERVDFIRHFKNENLFRLC